MSKTRSKEGPVRKKLKVDNVRVSGANESAISIWCKLLVNDKTIGNPTQLEFNSAHVNMDDIKKSIKKEFGDDLVGISAPSLKVYTATNKGPLAVDTTWNGKTHGGANSEAALIVKGQKKVSLTN